MRYLMTRRARVIHRMDDDGMSFEQCNIDAARKTIVELEHAGQALWVMNNRGGRLCRRCFPDKAITASPREMLWTPWGTAISPAD